MFHRAVQIIALVAISAVPRTATAASIVIDFDALSDGESVVGQYAGLTFSGSTVATSGISLNELEFPPKSGLNVVFDAGGPMRVDFAGPVASVGGYFTYAVPFALSAYDAGDNLLGSVSSAFASNLGLSGDAGSSTNEFISFSGPGIAYVVFAGDGAGASFVLDDLTYDDAGTVPEAGTLSLLLLGLGVSLRQRGTRRS